VYTQLQAQVTTVCLVYSMISVVLALVGAHRVPELLNDL